MIANVHENHATAVESTGLHVTTKTGRAVLNEAEIIASIAAATRVDATVPSVRNEVADGTNTAADLARLDVKVTNVPRKTANTALIEIATMTGRTEDVRTRTNAVSGTETTATKTEIVTRTATIGALIVTTPLNVHTLRATRRSKYRLRCHLHLRRKE
jgi:hypothetical protein